MTATAIMQARRDGLVAESERLTDMVGTLDAAALRAGATKDALVHSVERLLTEVREGLPLTPEKYSLAKRVADVEALRQQIASAKWVTPALMDEYNSAVQRDVNLSAANEYFFAKITVTDRFGTRHEKWAECLMNGNWSVYYRTLDGKNIGIYENLEPEAAAPLWGVNEGLPEATQKAIEARVVKSRVEGFETKIEFLAKKQLADESDTQFQRNFDSL